MNIQPFSDGDTTATFRSMLEKTKQEIASLENDYILKVSERELGDHFIDKVSINRLNLLIDQYYIENQNGTDIDVSHDFKRAVFPGEKAVVRGTSLDIAIPYEGDQILWRLKPSTFNLNPYRQITVKENVIIVNFSFPDDSVNAEKLKQDIDRVVKALKQATDIIQRDVQQHNLRALQEIQTAIKKRKKLAEETTGIVMSLGIPIKRRDEPLIFTAPVKRRKSPVQRPTTLTEAYIHEPVLDDFEYQHILKILQSMSLVIERNPNSFHSLDEESIRDHFLLQLNGHYEGNATGETFNASGKTDIVIKVEGKNIFIAECKFWKGQKHFESAIEQLLSYLSWRDTKSALLVFNKTKDSSSVKQKMHEAMENHPEFKKTLSQQKESDSKYIFSKKSDIKREIIITTQLYDLPKR